MLSWLGFVASVEALASGCLGNVLGGDVVFFHPVIYMLIHKVEFVDVGFSDKSLYFHVALSFWVAIAL